MSSEKESFEVIKAQLDNFHGRVFNTLSEVEKIELSGIRIKGFEYGLDVIVAREGEFKSVEADELKSDSSLVQVISTTSAPMKNYIYIGAIQMINGIVISSQDRSSWLILKQHNFFSCTTKSEGQHDLFRASKYKLADLLAKCDESAPMPQELSDWDNTKPAGNEKW